MNAICIQESWLSDNDDLFLFLLNRINESVVFQKENLLLPKVDSSFIYKNI